jgi:CubicO group peptidase (beta-lactamase class C family)
MSGLKMFWLAVATSVLAISAFAADLPRAKPEDIGLSSERLKRMDEVLGAGVASKEIPGYVALVARRGKVAYFKASGVQDPGTGKPMSTDSIFRIYSMTKPITSTAVMILVEEGKISLSDPIAKYLPEFANVQVATNAMTAKDAAAIQTAAATRPILIVDLMRHTTGLTYAFMKALPGATPIEQMYIDRGANDLDVTNAEFVKRVATIPLKHQPGTTWQYGMNTDVLGRLVEVVSGMSLGEFMQKRIFAPLEMTDTSFQVPASKVARFAEPFAAERQGLILPYTEPTKPVKFEAGGQGLTSTPMDYLRFAQMTLNGGVLDGNRILSRKTVELMTMDHVGTAIDHGPLYFPGQSHGFGLGFAVRMDGPRNPGALSPMHGSNGEYFWAGYAGTFFWVDPKEQLIGIYMMQSVQHLLKYANTFKTLVVQSIVD